MMILTWLAAIILLAVGCGWWALGLFATGCLIGAIEVHSLSRRRRQ